MYVEALIPIVVLIVVLPHPAVAFPGVCVVLDLTLVPRIGACHSRAELLALAVSVTPTDVFAIDAQLVEGVLKVKVHTITLDLTPKAKADNWPVPCAVRPPQHALSRDCCIQPEGGGNQPGLPFSADPRQRAEAKPAGGFREFRNPKVARRSLATATGGRNPAAALCGLRRPLSVRAALHTHPAKHRSHPLHLLLPLHPAPRRVPVHGLKNEAGGAVSARAGGNAGAGPSAVREAAEGPARPSGEARDGARVGGSGAHLRGTRRVGMFDFIGCVWGAISAQRLRNST